MKCDVLIAGGGPAGLYTALNIRNKSVLVLEEHREIGLPGHCAGVVGKFVAQELSKVTPKLVDGFFRKIVFWSPIGTYKVEHSEPIAYHVNRPLLEERIASKVESIGHRILLRAKAVPRSLGRVKAGGNIYEYDIMVASDGASSNFKKVLYGTQSKYLYGLQLVTRLQSIPVDTLFILYSESLPSFFTWIIPLDNSLAKVGYASGNPSVDYLLYILERKAGLKVTNIVEKLGGLIPIDKPLRDPVLHNRIVFHGDAVPLTKPYTGGGLYYIFKLTPALARCIEEGSLREYTSYYSHEFYAKTVVEQRIVDILRRTQYYLPLPFIQALSRLNALAPRDFDDHHKLAVKSLATLLLMPLLWGASRAP
ncbi:MAG: NAD(P)/FAD-dependent oxidoreductase [Desulfurococcaceae archaeon]